MQVSCQERERRGYVDVVVEATDLEITRKNK